MSTLNRTNILRCVMIYYSIFCTPPLTTVWARGVHLLAAGNNKLFSYQPPCIRYHEPATYPDTDGGAPTPSTASGKWAQLSKVNPSGGSVQRRYNKARFRLKCLPLHIFLLLIFNGRQVTQ